MNGSFWNRGTDLASHRASPLFPVLFLHLLSYGARLAGCDLKKEMIMLTPMGVQAQCLICFSGRNLRVLSQISIKTKLKCPCTIYIYCNATYSLNKERGSTFSLVRSDTVRV